MQYTRYKDNSYRHKLRFTGIKLNTFVRPQRTISKGYLYKRDLHNNPVNIIMVYARKKEQLSVQDEMLNPDKNQKLHKWSRCKNI